MRPLSERVADIVVLADGPAEAAWTALLPELPSHERVVAVTLAFEWRNSRPTKRERNHAGLGVAEALRYLIPFLEGWEASQQGPHLLAFVQRVAVLPHPMEMGGMPGAAAEMQLGVLIADARALLAGDPRDDTTDPHDNDDRTVEERFNPALRDWLNARDFCSGDWPYNVPQNLLREADLAFGGGRILDEAGYPVQSGVRFIDNWGIDALYLGA